MRRLIVTLSAAAIAAAGAIADGRGGRAGGHRPALRAAADDRRGDRRVGGFPSGAVTFMFSDIEGSTRLVKALRERYPQVLAEHRNLVRAAITGQAGYEVDTPGDAFFSRFPARSRPRWLEYLHRLIEARGRGPAAAAAVHNELVLQPGFVIYSLWSCQMT